VNTEYTDNQKFQGWVLYDGECQFCNRMAGRFSRLLAARQFELLPLQTDWVRTRLGMSDAQLLAEMRLMRPDGTVVGGADAVVEIGRHVAWTWPLSQIARLPGAMNLLRMLYRWIARNRACMNGACEIRMPVGKGQSRVGDFLPLLVLPPAALLLRTRVPSWVFMWVMALALYGGCKWLSYREARRHGAAPTFRRRAGYLLAWPGMDAKEFFDEREIPAKPRGIE
jgi:predicted DCC family thiol-disulfide oxidoreductase YuxK